MAELIRGETEDQHSPGEKETDAKQNTKMDHPKYIDMVKDAISNLKQPRGALTCNILNFICANYKLENKTVAIRSMKITLKTGVKIGVFDTVGRYADKYVLAGEGKTTVKRPCVKKHSQTSSSISEEVIEYTADIANMEKAKLEMTSSTNTPESSESSFLR